MSVKSGRLKRWFWLGDADVFEGIVFSYEIVCTDTLLETKRVNGPFVYYSEAKADAIEFYQDVLENARERRLKAVSCRKDDCKGLRLK